MIHADVGVECIQIDAFHPNGKAQSGNFEIARAPEAAVKEASRTEHKLETSSLSRSARI